MKLKTFFFVLFFFCAENFLVFAQGNRGVLGGFQTEKFPLVTFTWNTANPSMLSEKSFSLEEEGVQLDIVVQSIEKEYSKPISKNILFLWEDMYSHTGQYDYAKKVLVNFFSQVKNDANCHYNIGVFDRKEEGCSLVQFLLDDFTTDRNQLVKVVLGKKNNIEQYRKYPLQTDLYFAISEGIDVLKSQAEGDFGAIIVITAGLNIKAAGASTEMETIRRKAIESDIPIYVLKYPIYGNTTEINTLSESTYGSVCSTLNFEEAVSGLMQYYHSFDRRYIGRSYQISYLSNLEKDGKPHSVFFFVDKVAQDVPLFVSPSETMWGWVEDNILLSVLIGFIFLCFLVLVIILLARKKKNFNSEIKKQMQESQFRAESAEREAKRLRDEQQDFLVKQEKEKELDRIVDFRKLIETKRIHPRLNYVIDGVSQTYIVEKPLIKIGRCGDNDLVLDYPEVSRYHAELRFESRGFIIYDKKSTNKVVVNGIPLENDGVLRSGDTLKIGRIFFKFFL